MAFSFKRREIFKTEVTVPVPNDQGGVDENTFVAHFKHASSAEVKALREISDAEVVRKQLVGWDMVDEDTKQVVPYTEEARDAVLSVASAPYHIGLAFYRTLSGGKAKNS